MTRRAEATPIFIPQRKAYMTGTVNHPPAAEPADLIASPAGNSIPLNQFTKEEDLGTHSVEGVSAHGVREIQTIPAASSRYRKRNRADGRVLVLG